MEVMEREIQEVKTDHGDNCWCKPCDNARLLAEAKKEWVE